MTEPTTAAGLPNDFEEMLAGLDRIIHDKALQQELLDAGLLVRIKPEAEARPAPPSAPPALDVERLARTHQVVSRSHPMTGDQWYECRCSWGRDDNMGDGTFSDEWPRHLAAEYARLQEPER